MPVPPVLVTLLPWTMLSLREPVHADRGGGIAVQHYPVTAVIVVHMADDPIDVVLGDVKSRASSTAMP